MKIRTCFVSNSSSSSFVIIDANKGYDKLESTEYSIYKVGNIGKTEFGWGPENIKDIHSRINFAYLQTIYSKIKGKKWKQMLEDVIKKNSEIKEIEYIITDNYDEEGKTWGYIDHQSSACEGENIEIFENKNKLRDFVFGKGSKIHLNNDNH